MCSASASTGYYLEKYKIPLNIVADLPKEFHRVPSHIVTRLKSDGVIKIHSKKYKRNIWGPGVNWDRYM